MTVVTVGWMVTKGCNLPPNCGRFACGSGSGHHRGCGTGGNVGPGAWAHAESLEGAERERLERVVSGIDRYGYGGYGRGGGASAAITTITTPASAFGGGAETTTTTGGGTGGATPGGRGNLSLTRRRRLIHARQHATGGTTGGTTAAEGDVGALVGPLIRVRPLTSEYGEAVQIGAAIGEEDVEEDEEELDDEEALDDEGGDEGGDDEEDLDDGTRGRLRGRAGVRRAEVAVIRDDA